MYRKCATVNPAEADGADLFFALEFNKKVAETYPYSSRFQGGHWLWFYDTSDIVLWEAMGKSCQVPSVSRDIHTSITIII